MVIGRCRFGFVVVRRITSSVRVLVKAKSPDLNVNR